MRILHLTDTHLGARRQIRGAPAGYRRADDHLAAVRAALRPAWDQQVDLVVHSGDVFDRSRPPARAVQAAAELFVETARRVPLVIMPGNHDRRGLKRWLPHHLDGLHVVDRPTHLRVAGVALALVPFVRDAEAWSRAAAHAWAGAADLLVAHQAFHGARVPGLTFRVGDQRDTVGAAHLPRGVRWVLCGHIHPRQATQVGEAVVVQPGSTERTASSEAGETKGMALWELGREVQWRFVDVPTRPMVVVAGVRDLRAVTPGALVRVRAPELEPEVRARGGWLWGGPPRPRAPRPVDPQLRLL